MTAPASTAHCMTCHREVSTTHVTRIMYPNGRTAERSQCTACGTTIKLTHYPRFRRHFTSIQGVLDALVERLPA